MVTKIVGLKHISNQDQSDLNQIKPSGKDVFQRELPMDQFIKTPKRRREDQQLKVTVFAFSFFLLCFAGLAALGQSNIAKQHNGFDNQQFIARATIADRA